MNRDIELLDRIKAKYGLATNRDLGAALGLSHSFVGKVYNGHYSLAPLTVIKALGKLGWPAATKVLVVLRPSGLDAALNEIDNQTAKQNQH